MRASSAQSARIAVIGPLVDNDLVFAEHVARYGHEVTVMRKRGVGSRGAAFGGGGFSRFTAADIVEYAHPFDLVGKVRGFDYVFTFTAAFPFGLFYLLPFYPLLNRFGWPRYMNIGTGSDIMERAIAGGLDGVLQRLGMRNAHMNMVLNYPEALRNVARLGISNACVLPFPYLPARSEEGGEIDVGALRGMPGTLLALHASHLDWGETDNAPGRVSTKGNDRFIRALARLKSEGIGRIRVVMLDRGSDRHQARRMVEDLGLGDWVIWREHMSRSELYQTMAACDLVVDQFDVGGLGGIAWEAMSLGKPVLMHLAQPNDLLAYDDATPVLQASTEDDILAALRLALNPEWRATQGAEIARWMALRDPGRIVPRYLLYASIATGKDLCGFWSHERHGRGHVARR